MNKRFWIIGLIISALTFFGPARNADAYWLTKVKNWLIMDSQIENCPIGAETPTTGAFTTLTATTLGGIAQANLLDKTAVELITGQWTFSDTTTLSGLTAVTNATGSTSPTTGALVVTGGLGVGEKLYVGGDLLLAFGADLYMSTALTGEYGLYLKDSQADALSIIRGSTDMMVFDSSTPRITITPTITVTGAIVCDDGTEASSTTTGSIQTDGGLGVAKKIYAGADIVMPVGDLYMSTAATGNYEIYIKDNQADALSLVRGSTDMIVFNTSTPLITITPATTITGAFTTSGGISNTGDIASSVTATTPSLRSASAGDVALVINAHGTGTIGIGNVSTGAVTITPATTVTGVLTSTGGVLVDGGSTIGVDIAGSAIGINIDGVMTHGIYISPTITQDTSVRPINIAYNYDGATDNTGVDMDLYGIRSTITQTGSNNDEDLADRGYLQGIRSDVHVDGYVDVGYAMYAKMYVDGVSKATEIMGLNVVMAHGANAITLDEAGQYAGIGVSVNGTADVTCAGTGWGQVSGMYIAWKENNAMTVSTSGIYIGTFASSNLDAGFRINTAGTTVSSFRSMNVGGTVTQALDIVGAHTNAFAFPAEATAPVAAHVADENSTGRIAITVGGDTRYLYYYN